MFANVWRERVNCPPKILHTIPVLLLLTRVETLILWRSSTLLKIFAKLQSSSRTDFVLLTYCIAWNLGDWMFLEQNDDDKFNFITCDVFKSFHVIHSFEKPNLACKVQTQRLDKLKLLSSNTANQKWSPRGQIFTSLASKLPCPRLEYSTIFWTVETLLENAKNLAEILQIPFLFSKLEHRLSQAGLPPMKLSPMTKSLLFLQFHFFF